MVMGMGMVMDEFKYLGIDQVNIFSVLLDYSGSG